MTIPSPSLETRLVRLEKSAHRWKIATLSLAFVSLAALSLGQITIVGGGPGGGGMKAPLVTTDRLVANKSISLKDAKGNERLLLSTDGDGPLITIKNADEKTLFSVSADEKTASLLIQDSAGKKLFAAP